MKKPATSPYSLADNVKDRWSPLAFSERLVEPETLSTLLEAARWAPSCYNDQPWHFVVAPRDQADAFQRILQCLAEPNQAWAARAAVLMVSVTRTVLAKTGKPNPWAWHDIGLAAGNLLAQATSMGVSVHQMGGFDREKAREALAIPEGYEAVTAIALGYAGDPDSLPESLRARELAPRTRKDQTDFVFLGTWGTPR